MLKAIVGAGINEEEIGFSPEDFRNDTGNDTPSTMEFEVSGLGGVQPDDNFAIKVKRSHARTGNPTFISAKHNALRSKTYPKHIREALKRKSTSEPQFSKEPVIKEEIISAARKSLPSSALPPASFLPFDSTSSGDVDSDLESDVSSGPSSSEESSDRGPDQAPRLINISPTHEATYPEHDSESSSEDGSDEDDDQSVDLLATARALDPKTIYASEREYDAAFADRLADEIPAGSSAATAGGGSGFNSPASAAVGHGEERRSTSKKPSITSSGTDGSRAKNLKRARTSDSLATQMQNHTGKSQKLN